MTKHHTSIRLPDISTRQIAELISTTGLMQSEVIATAIDRMYQQEIKTMKSHIITRRMYVRQPNDLTLIAVDAAPVFESDDYEFGLFEVDGLPKPVAYVHYWHTNITFTTADWQGQQPQDLDEIPDYNWVDEDGNDAMIMDGLPVKQLHR